MTGQDTERKLREEIHILTKRQEWQMRVLLFLLFLWLSAVAFFSWSKVGVAHAESVSSDSILRVRGLIVQDQNGIDRVYIGAPLPAPMVLGKRFKRSIVGSGILILDAEGNERGGYITTGDGSAQLSLDSVGDELADFGTEADGKPGLSLRDGHGGQTEIGIEDGRVSSLRLKIGGDAEFLPNSCFL
jgi:hypothetical protein